MCMGWNGLKYRVNRWLSYRVQHWPRIQKPWPTSWSQSPIDCVQASEPGCKQGGGRPVVLRHFPPNPPRAELLTPPLYTAMMWNIHCNFEKKNTSEMEVARSALNCLHCLLGLHCLHCFIASNAHTVWTLLKSLKKWHVSPYCYMVREPIKNYLTDFFR